MKTQITEEIITEHGLSKEEYKRILQILGREPTITELGIFSVMWSEHASYKNSILQIKTLPRTGKGLLTKTGEENAGVVDIGDGLAVAFKMESHNHPSALEPYQGAATGVGGILRDIFTMGARPVASLNSLRFGNLNNNHVKHLLKGVVKGIADYGNCMGVPTVAGEIYFEDSYEGNPLINVMTAGILKHENLATASAKGPGNYVLYVGSTTGRDGIHGCTFASVELSEESAEKRTSVQVGDPFMEKLLLEATLEVIEKKLVIGIQDMGAAGLTCSSSEMAAKGGTGIDIDVALVPKREKGMTPYEIMLSESQERMLLVIKPENFEKVEDIFKKWDLNIVKIGEVTADKMLRVRENKKVVAEIPANTLVLGGDAPVYKREKNYPKYLDKVHKFNPDIIPLPDDYNVVLKNLLSSPNIASKNYVYQQYDYMVRINTIIEPGSDAAVCRVKGTNKALAMTTDCNGRYCYLDPYEGAKGAVAEAARNIVCAGGKPLAITNCLNFGNPYKREIYWTFAEVIRGMGDACKAFDTPVTGGNVSFYNETEKSAVYPTPTIGMLGLLEDKKFATTQYFKNEGDLIILLGNNCNEIGGSEYLELATGKVSGHAPKVNLEYEKSIQKVCYEAIRLGIVKSAHDCSEGGLAVALAESGFKSENFLGAKINFEMKNRPDIELFGESHSRIVVSIEPNNISIIKKLAKKHKVNFIILGSVIKNYLRINDLIDVKVDEIFSRWHSSITEKLTTKTVRHKE
ncbi:MAG: phosphoribosylformylglycinamidine synthase subunit PurL [Candidatus Cloacimonetes bacterium]|nr:phosphoribosylformylglycinamidine synthase subunit PurL [Candidatus Cloacimonadota bacterium]